MNGRVVKFAFLGVLILVGGANAQNIAAFRNRMNTIADVTLTRVGTTETQTFTISGNQSLNVPFDGDNFDIQVVPRDEPDSGFRLSNINLRDFANRGRSVVLRGEFATGPMKLVCCQRRRKCVCCWQSTQGERIAVVLEDEAGFAVRSPKMKYNSDTGEFTPR
jgi:hypothetical protein